MTNQVPAEVFRTWREVRDITGFDNTDIREAVENMCSMNDRDFEVSDWRFIDKDAIDEIQREELESDLYMLGCFNAWFLADILDIDQDVIESMQSAEAFEALGKLVISTGKLEALQEAYASADGYGHHFAHYDFNEYEIGDYYVFRCN